MDERKLWSEIGWLFDKDDGGALSVLSITFSGANSVAAAYDFVRSRAKYTTESERFFWSLTEETDKLISSVPNAAQLVASETAEAFHVSFEGIEVRDVVVPRLGVHVFPTFLEIDFHPGKGWNAETLIAFMRFLNQVAAQIPEARIHADEHWDRDTRARFLSALSKVAP